MQCIHKHTHAGTPQIHTQKNNLVEIVEIDTAGHPLGGPDERRQDIFSSNFKQPDLSTATGKLGLSASSGLLADGKMLSLSVVCKPC